MTRWQRRARFVAAFVALSAAGAAYWTMGTRRQQPTPPAVAEIAPTVTSQVTDGRAAQTKGAREDVTVDFDEQRTYTDGRSVATGVTVRVENRGGRSFVVTGKEGEVGANQSTIQLSGDVVLKASDGLTAWAGTASYADGEGIVRAPGPVRFTRGDTHGSGTGFSFDKVRDLMTVHERAVAHVTGGPDGPPMDMTAGLFIEARRDRYIRLEGGARIARGDQVFEAQDIMVFLLPDVDEPDRIELRGNGRITGGESLGSLRTMRARDINLDYAEDGRSIEHATLAGQGAVTLAGSGGGQGQRLSAEWIDVSLGPDRAITSLVSRDNVVATLPGGGGLPSRTVRATELTGDGAAGAGLTTMRFSERVEFREGGTAKTPPTRIARSRALTLALAPGAGTLQRATFMGGTQFDAGTMRAVSDEARYHVDSGSLVLLGKPGTPAPRVTDTGLQVDGDTMTIDLDRTAITATGNVSSVMQPATTRTGSGAARTPALLDAGQALYAASSELAYDSQTRRGTYSGKARLWQGDTTIRAERIVLDESSGDLSAEGSVQSAFVLDAPPAAAGATPAAPAPTRPRGTIARAESFRYDDATRTATYTKSAHLGGPQGDVDADRVAIVLGEGTRALERLEAYGAVVARVDGRDARGARLTHVVSDDRYVITGTPVQFTEACRVTTGRTLTFYGTAGRIIVDGNDAARPVTKADSRCTPTPPRN